MIPNQDLIWLLSEKALRILNGFIIGVFLAKYLGPEDFGKISYILSVVFLLTPFTSWGLEAILVRHLFGEKYEKAELLATSFLLMILGLFFASLMIQFGGEAKTEPYGLS